MNNPTFWVKIMFVFLQASFVMDKSTIVLSVVTVVLVGYVVFEQARSGGGRNTPSALGRRRRQRLDCSNVSIDSPDFARCSTELGAGRTVLPGNPVNVAHNINNAFVADSYEPQGAAAFPLKPPRPHQPSGPGRKKPNPFSPKNPKSRESSDPLMFNLKSGQLGAAVSPSAMGASMEEIMQSTKKAVETTVESNTGGQLNLLHPLN